MEPELGEMGVRESRWTEGLRGRRSLVYGTLHHIERQAPSGGSQPLGMKTLRWPVVSSE